LYINSKLKHDFSGYEGKEVATSNIEITFLIEAVKVKIL